MSEQDETDGVELDFDLDQPEMNVTCPDGWMVHFQHGKVADKAHIVEFSTGVGETRLGDAVDMVLGIAESLMDANYMATPDEESEIALGWDPLGDVFDPEGNKIDLDQD
ncbi:hypothetical protein [Nocardioides insulae]|uniref:hypothetical protein n=1 Tax=Nocardioides insulae TaxID=394734 RepID=UPI00041D2CFB|nr:hypothetical protein [Nocardioides insulae]